MVFNKHNKIRYSICHLLSKVRKDKCNNYGLLSLLCCLLSLFYESHMQYFNIKHRSYALVRKISLNVVGFLNVRIFICMTIIPWYLKFFGNYFWSGLLPEEQKLGVMTYPFAFYCWKTSAFFNKHFPTIGCDWPNHVKLLGRLKKFLVTGGLKLQRWYQEGN